MSVRINKVLKSQLFIITLTIFALVSLNFNPLIINAESQSSHSAEASASFDETTHYNVELMEENGLSPMDPSKYTSIEEVIESVIDELGVDRSLISISYTNLVTGETYTLNEHEPKIAGSVYKFPLVAMYLDAIQAGELSFETIIPPTFSYVGPGSTGNQGPVDLQTAIDTAIIHSDNDTAWSLLFYMFDSWYSFQYALADFAGYYDMPEGYYGENYMTAALIDQSLQKVANNPASYGYLIDLMMQTEPKQLFSLYVDENMATKYGRLDDVVNDAGIFYVDDTPVYTLAAMTSYVPNGDAFLEILNLRVNEWTMAHTAIE